jgi:hypothetical protein
MRFALLGDHVDGLDMARALVESSRHELAVYSGPKPGLDALARWGINPVLVGDLEEILADPLIEGIIVAGSPAARPGQLKRALQSERHVLCVHPAGDSPDLAYEAGMIQADVRCALLPLLPEAMHPGIRRLAALAHGSAASTAIRANLGGEGEKARGGEGERGRRGENSADGSSPFVTASPPASTLPFSASAVVPASPLPSETKLLEIERWSTEEVLLQAEMRGPNSNRLSHAAMAGWDTLRLLGGEVGELYVLAADEELGPASVVLVSGQFVRGGLFQQTLLPCQSEARLRLALVTVLGRAELFFPHGWPGPAELTYRDAEGAVQKESWPAADPWPGLVERFESEVIRWKSGGAAGKEISLIGNPPRLGWHDEIRAMELDDAARRSLRRRRASTLEYQEAVEEASFKGAMTLLGCGLLLVSMLLLIFSAWLPWLGWLILPAIAIFLVMQALRLVVKPEERQGKDQGNS